MTECPRRWIFKTKYGFIALLVGASIALPHQAMAAEDGCKLTMNPISLNFGELDPTSVAIGQQIGAWSTFTITPDCSDVPQDENIFLEQFALHDLAGGVADTWQTGIPGIGIKVMRVSPNRAYISTVNAGGMGYLYGGGGLRTSEVGNFRAALMRTGDVQAGSYTKNIFYAVTFYNAKNEFGKKTYVPISVDIKTRTCSVDADSDKVVKLPTIGRSSLSLSNISGAKEFDIRLDCGLSPGSSVWITLTDATNPVNRSSNLTTVGVDNVALRIIRIGHNDDPVYYGADSAAIGNENQWDAGEPIDGKLDIPLAVGYIATGDVENIGSISARATFTLSYQ